MLPISDYVTLQDAATETGNGTILPVADRATVMLQIKGTFSAAIKVETSCDGDNWEGVCCYRTYNLSQTEYITMPGHYVISVAGYKYLRARIDWYESGAVTIVATATTLIHQEQIGAMQAPEDGASNSYYGAYVSAHRFAFNGVTWDRERANVDATVLASAARTATTNSSDQTNYNGRGVIVTLDVTAITDTPSLTLSIEAKMGSNYEALLTASAAVTATGTHTYIVYPGVGEAGADVVQVAGFPLPRTWRVTVTHADADSATYSVTASVIL
jgi:hypothetical protein